MARQFFVGGNWKMNGVCKSIDGIVDFLNAGPINEKVEVVVAPSFPYLDYVRQRTDKRIGVAAQNASKELKGAFTGDVSVEQLLDLKVSWVILGHSERRSIFGETSELVGDKVGLALKSGLSVIVCVGETLDQRKSGNAFDVVAEQMKGFVPNVTDWGKVVIAYEPVWAIGTGVTATPEQAEEMHGQVRDWLKGNVNENVAGSTRIIYGGSVTAANSQELAAKPNIDGFLVGGASLKPDFIKIINSRS